MNPILDTLAARAPDDVVVDESGHALTACELLAGVEAFRTLLVQAGIDRLGLLANNSAAWIMADLACQSAGICLLPMPVFFADRQLTHCLQSVGVDAVLTDDPQRMLDVLGPSAVVADADPLFGLALLRIADHTRPSLPPGTQKITFTSGSTGSPRGVCLGIEQQLRVARALDEALQLCTSRHLCLLPLSTLLENVGGVYYPLLTGGTVIVPPDTDTGFSGSTGLDMQRMLQTLNRHQPTSIILLPQMLVGLMAALEDGWRSPAELKFAAVGGAKVSTALLRRARELGLPVYEGYGLSETGSVACLNHPGSDLIGSVGRPLSHVEVSIEADEIYITGNSFLGYVGESAGCGTQRTATGDLGERDAAGFIHLHGRRSNVLISSFGRNISPEWIESEVMHFPEIAQCIVFGDDRPYCTALIAPADPIAEDRLIQARIDAVNAQLPDYARVQRWYRLADALGSADGLYTENGRPRRTAIAARFAPHIESLYTEITRAIAQ